MIDLVLKVLDAIGSQELKLYISYLLATVKSLCLSLKTFLSFLLSSYNGKIF